MALDPDGPRNYPLLWAPAAASPAVARRPAQLSRTPGRLPASPQSSPTTRPASDTPPFTDSLSKMTDSTHSIQISPGTPPPQCPSRMWGNIMVPAWSPKSPLFSIIFCDRPSHISSPSSAPFDLPCQAGSSTGSFKARGAGLEPSRA